MNNPSDNDLLAALGSLRPEPAAIDHGELLYRAGYAAGEAAAARRPVALAWRATAVAATAASLLLVLNRLPSAPPVADPPQIAVVEPLIKTPAWDLDGVLAIRPKPARPARDVTPTEYSASPPLTARALLDELLNKPQSGGEA